MVSGVIAPSAREEFAAVNDDLEAQGTGARSCRSLRWNAAHGNTTGPNSAFETPAHRGLEANPDPLGFALNGYRPAGF
jgi:hypothetical protein